MGAIRILPLGCAQIDVLNVMEERMLGLDEITFRMLQLRQKGYCCSQILLILALDSEDKTNPDLVRAVGGLCYGIGSGEVCGCLSGGACLLSYYVGKGFDTEEADGRFQLMVSQLVDWFREAIGQNYGGVRCDDILTQHPDKSACGPIVAATYGKAMEILASHGWNSSRGRHR